MPWTKPGLWIKIFALLIHYTVICKCNVFYVLIIFPFLDSSDSVAVGNRFSDKRTSVSKADISLLFHLQWLMSNILCGNIEVPYWYYNGSDIVSLHYHNFYIYTIIHYSFYSLITHYYCDLWIAFIVVQSNINLCLCSLMII